MMREILFRGKRIDNNEWVYGFYSQFHNRPVDDEPNSHQIFELLKENEEPIILGKTSIGGVWHIIKPETLGQYTGLTDKNGTKIFEGDIVEGTEIYPNGKEYTSRRIVEWIVDRWYPFADDDYEYGNWWEDLTRGCEVIGNIYDIPELCEV